MCCRRASTVRPSVRMSVIDSNMLAEHLSLLGVLVTSQPGGHPGIEPALACQEHFTNNNF